MSGGSFDYALTHMNDFASELERRLEDIDNQVCTPVPDDIKQVLYFLAAQAKELSHRMHDVKWYFSGYIGDDALRKRIEKAWDEVLVSVW